MKISLTEIEWETLQAEVSLYTDLVPAIGLKKKGKIELVMGADDWDELSGYVAATANHSENKKNETILDRIFGKIETGLSKQK
jgi:hypothetical protein